MKFWSVISGALGVAMVAAVAVSAHGQDRFLPGDVFREIVDGGSGTRWLLVRDDVHPGGPGKMVAVGASEPGRPRGVIRAGDRVVVEEHSGRMDLRLEAVALAPAAAGARIDVRLRLGGRVLRAIAVGPGRVALDSAFSGGRP